MGKTAYLRGFKVFLLNGITLVLKSSGNMLAYAAVIAAKGEHTKY